MEIDTGRRPGLTTDERERLKRLERENREQRRANEILKSASAFFAAELDCAPRSVSLPTRAATGLGDVHDDHGDLTGLFWRQILFQPSLELV